MFFLFIFTCQTFYSTGLTAWYFANRTLITQKHCINTSKPWLKCNGKCFLSKKILEKEKQQEKQEQRTVDWVVIAPCTLSTISFEIRKPDPVITRYPAATAEYAHAYMADIFHPPTGSVL